MNADSIVDTVSERAARGETLGSVIVSIQLTQMDEDCSLRIFCKLDKMMKMLAAEMGFRVSSSGSDSII